MKVTITDPFWSHYRDLVRSEMIPYQWNVLNDTADISIERERDDPSIPNEKSHALENFRIAAGIHTGHHYGMVFQDSDVYKWLEAVAYSLAEKPDGKLQEKADQVVDLIAQAQEDDGYLDTYFTIEEPDRKFKSLMNSHELYCAGHFMEAAVAYHQATGNQKVLETAEKLAGCIERNLGPEGQFGYDGHEEVEIGLMKLYHLTGDDRYLKLARHFLMIRGTDKDFFGEQRKTDPGKKPVIGGMENFPRRYFQVHKPVLEQDTAEGHAVRQVYLLTAMADVAASTKNQTMLDACRKVWNNLTQRRMYITGGIGSTVHGEAFTFDYDLPNDTMYCETCASVGLIFFARQMLRNESRGDYADVMERALYNTAISGTALDGKHFFYVNPLEVDPAASKLDPGKSHVKPVRPQWLGCACCPPNLARLLASLDQYVYTVKGSTCLVDLYISSETTIDVAGKQVTVTQETDYPKSGEIRIRVKKPEKVAFRLGVRIPGWTDSYQLRVDGQESGLKPEDGEQESCLKPDDGEQESRLKPEDGEQESRLKPENGFVFVSCTGETTEITLSLDMKPELWQADPRVKADLGKVAVTRGPLVYCLEEKDNGGGLQLLSISKTPDFLEKEEHGELGDIITLQADGRRILLAKESGPLYRKVGGSEQPDKTQGAPFCAAAEQPDKTQRAPFCAAAGQPEVLPSKVSEQPVMPVKLHFIPYYTWANRGAGEMTVWVRRG